jgi:hypothetical protein
MKICFCCEATESPLWRKDEETGSTLCNACGLFVKRAKKRKSTESPPKKRARDQIRLQQEAELQTRNSVNVELERKGCVNGKSGKKKSLDVEWHSKDRLDEGLETKNGLNVESQCKKHIKIETKAKNVQVHFSTQQIQSESTIKQDKETLSNSQVQTNFQSQSTSTNQASPSSPVYNLQSLAKVATSHEEQAKFSFSRIEKAILYHLQVSEEPVSSTISWNCNSNAELKLHVKCGSVVEYHQHLPSGQQSPAQVKYAIIQHLFRDRSGNAFFFPIPLQLIEGRSCCNGLSDLKVDAAFKDLYREECVIFPSRLVLLRAISKIILP